MTDKDIIASLECCTEGIYICDKDCPCYDVKSDTRTAYCKFELLGDALDLINRQQAEIERLKTAFENSQKATKFWHKRVKTARAEAIKEFADKMKEVMPDIDDSYIEAIVEEHIDNLIKEMVGADNDT